VIYRDTQISEDTLIRVFDNSINPIELKWHRDDEDRIIKSINSTDWMIQLEDKLPQPLDIAVFIEKGQWHRLIKGTGELKVKIIR
jgi:hypothetical protein